MADGPEPTPQRELTMAELMAQDELVIDTDEVAQVARPGERDDELLDDPPETDHHLGRFGAWRATRKLRWIVGGSLGAALLIGLVAFIQHTGELRYERLHPLPEVEATIAPGTPREMSVSEGTMRVALSREAPSINLLHLPDRDITLASGADKAQFKVEVRDGETVRIKVLTGEIVEALTQSDARPLLER